MHHVSKQVATLQLYITPDENTTGESKTRVVNNSLHALTKLTTVAMQRKHDWYYIYQLP
jgi:hypothetical protein